MRGMAKVGCQVVWCPNGPQDYGIDRWIDCDTHYNVHQRISHIGNTIKITISPASIVMVAIDYTLIPATPIICSPESS